MISLARAWLNDFRLTLAFMTRLPVGQLTLGEGENQDGQANLARALRTSAVVGGLIGSLSGAAFALAHWIGLPPLACALLAVAAAAIVTGALHEDGLADLADGLGGGWTKARKLEIMRDSRIGSFGAIALILSIGLKAGALAEIAAPGDGPGDGVLALIVAHGCARAWLPSIMWLLPTARQDGLAAQAARPALRHVAEALVLAVLLACICLGPALGLAALAASGLGAWAIALIARHQLGGHTGDVLGAAEQVGEIFVLLLLAASWSVS